MTVFKERYMTPEELSIKSSDGDSLKIKNGFPSKEKKSEINLQDGHPDGLKTKVTIKNHLTGEVVFEGSNKTMIAGSEFMALHMFNLPHDEMITTTYNNVLGLENTVFAEEPENKYCAQLFCVGTSGCNRESGLSYDVVNKWWIDPDDLIPFQYVPYDRDPNALKRSIYFGRKPLTDKKMVAYYFKKFDSDPVLKRQLEDGTPIDTNIYSDMSELSVQTLVVNSMTITIDDLRDYFIKTTGINDGRYNCLQLCLAWYTVINGFSYYQDIRPCTRINFPNRYLSDLGLSWDIVYQIYF